MPSTEQLELIGAVIDGEATSDELRLHRDFLDRSGEYREAFDATQKLARALDSVPLVDPPPMREWIMGVLRRTHPRRPARNTRRRVLAIGWAAAAILVIAIALHRATPPPPHDAGATMMAMPLLGQANAGPHRLTVRGDGDVVQVEAAAPAGATIEWDPQRLLPLSGSAPASPRLRLRRRPGAAGPTVIRLRPPDNQLVQVTIDLR